MGVVVSFATEKGGSKKTTQNEIVAEIFAELGHSVCILDSDPQQTISKWVERRNELINQTEDAFPKIDLVQEFDYKIFYKVIDDLRKKYDVLIIDTQGRDSEFLRETYVMSDIIYIPVTPVQNDLETMPSIIELLHRTTLRQNKDCVLRTMLVDVPTHTKDQSKEMAIQKLKDIGLLDIAPLSFAYTKKRKVYSEAQTYGLTGSSMHTLFGKTSATTSSKYECELLKKELLSILEDLIEKNQ